MKRVNTPKLIKTKNCIHNIFYIFLGIFLQRLRHLRYTGAEKLILLHTNLRLYWVITLLCIFHQCIKTKITLITLDKCRGFMLITMLYITEPVITCNFATKYLLKLGQLSSESYSIVLFTFTWYFLIFLKNNYGN